MKSLSEVAESVLGALAAYWISLWVLARCPRGSAGRQRREGPGASAAGDRLAGRRDSRCWRPDSCPTRCAYGAAVAGAGARRGHGRSPASCPGWWLRGFRSPSPAPCCSASWASSVRGGSSSPLAVFVIALGSLQRADEMLREDSPVRLRRPAHRGRVRPRARAAGTDDSSSAHAIVRASRPDTGRRRSTPPVCSRAALARGRHAAAHVAAARHGVEHSQRHRAQPRRRRRRPTAALRPGRSSARGERHRPTPVVQPCCRRCTRLCRASATRGVRCRCSRTVIRSRRATCPRACATPSRKHRRSTAQRGASTPRSTTAGSP